MRVSKLGLGGKLYFCVCKKEKTQTHPYEKLNRIFNCSRSFDFLWNGDCSLP